MLWLWLWLGLALAGPGELRAARLEGLATLQMGERPLQLTPVRGEAVARRYLDERGRIYARAEVFDLLEDVDPTHMGYYWHKRRRAHRWATIMWFVPPPWGLSAYAAHLTWKGRAAKELGRALNVYNAPRDLP